MTPISDFSDLRDGVITDSTISGTGGDDTLNGSKGAGDDVINGLGGDDVLNGGRGQDFLGGGQGRDSLHGGAGDDTLHGGLGADKLSGGPGADLYVYSHLSDSTVGPAGRDHVFFAHDGDLIDLSQIDADATLDGDQAFHLVDQFSKQAGELVIRVTGSGALVEGDVDGDGHADFAIAVATAQPLVGSDFVL